MESGRWFRLDRRRLLTLGLVACCVAGLALIFVARRPETPAPPSPPPPLTTDARVTADAAKPADGYRGPADAVARFTREQLAFCASSGLRPYDDPQSCGVLVAAVQSGRRGLISYKVPPTMTRGERHAVAAVIADATADQTAEMTEASRRVLDRIPGVYSSETTVIHTTMSARLAGSGFRIEAQSPEKQTVMPGSRGRWDWSVEPLKEGGDNRRLVLTAQAYLSVDGRESSALQIETFEREITVEVRWLDRIEDLVESGRVIQGAGALIIVFGGWLAWMMRRARGKPEAAPTPIASFRERLRRRHAR